MCMCACMCACMCVEWVYGCCLRVLHKEGSRVVASSTSGTDLYLS